ncbi:hypothetical protein EDB86DRAFT_2840227 [Lactarius hatsudake]|nr:hypothetical protein EDB86DRAFT_2840227 [Lactarius hatsudake]
MVKAPRDLVFRLKVYSVEHEAWEVGRVLPELEPIRENITRLGGITPTAGKVFTLTLKFVRVGGKGLPEIRNRDGRNGEWEREVDGADGGLLRGVKVCEPISMSLGGRCGDSEGGGWGKMITSGGTTRGGDIGPNVVSCVASSGLSEGGVMRLFGESLSRHCEGDVMELLGDDLSSPGGVVGVESIGEGQGEIVTLGENLSGAESESSTSLSEEGGRSGELSRTASESTTTVEVART